jgi:hypothetical protein
MRGTALAARLAITSTSATTTVEPRQLLALLWNDRHSRMGAFARDHRARRPRQLARRGRFEMHGPAPRSARDDAGAQHRREHSRSET